MKLRPKLLLGAALGAAAMALSATSASAYIACSGDACWHVKEHYSYPADSKVIVNEDSWKWGPSEHFTWREHAGRGYWRGDAWTDF
jgi:hypothetical protein